MFNGKRFFPGILQKAHTYHRKPLIANILGSAVYLITFTWRLLDWHQILLWKRWETKNSDPNSWHADDRKARHLQGLLPKKKRKLISCDFREVCLRQRTGEEQVIDPGRRQAFPLGSPTCHFLWPPSRRGSLWTSRRSSFRKGGDMQGLEERSDVTFWRDMWSTGDTKSLFIYI